MPEIKKSYIPNRLKNAAENGYVAGAEDIIDDALGRSQDDINNDIYVDGQGVIPRLETLEAQVDFDGSFTAENTPAGITSGSGKIATANAVRGAIDVKTGYFSCSTVAGTAKKEVSAAGYVLSGGGNIKISMENANTASNATLDIKNGGTSTGEKPLYYNGERASADNSWEAGEVISVYYDTAGTGAYYATNAQGGGGKAEKIKFDNTEDGLAAENVQSAIDEVFDYIPKTETPVTYPSSTVDGVQFGSNGNWESKDARKLYFISYTYTAGDTLKIETGANNCVFAFLTSNSHTEGQPIDYCTGTGQKNITANKTKSFAIPSTCAYICVYAYWNSTSVLPESMKVVNAHIETKGEIQAKIDVVNNKYSPLESSTQYVPVVSSNILVTGVGISGDKWATETKRKIYFIPYTYKQGDVLVLTAQSGYSVTAALVKNNSHTVGNDVDYATGTGRIAVGSGSTKEIPIPSDCNYIMLYAYYDTTSVLPETTIVRNNFVISAQYIDDEIKNTYFSEVYHPTFEAYKSGVFLNIDGTYGYSNDYTVYKLSNFKGNEIFDLRFWMAGTVPLATVYDASGTSLGYISPSSTTQKYHTFTLNLNNYTDPSYVLCNTYQYETHEPVDLSNHDSFDERYPEYVQTLKNEIISQVSGVKSISILFIGNSLTQDTISYLPLILKEIAPEIEFKIYDWYNSGATLAQQYAKFTNNQTCETFSKCENTTSWTNFSNSVTMSDILSTYDFDIVCLQEYSYYDFTEIELTTNYNNIVSYISANYAKPLKYITLIDQPNRSKVQTMYQQSVNYAKTFLKNTVCEDILNPGGALYLALQTSLDSLGDQQHLSPDGTHSQEGLPCVLQAYVNAIWILETLGTPKSVYNSQTRITAENFPNIHVPGPNLGTGVVEGTDAQYNIAQECAIKAFKLSRKYVNAVIDVLAETM